MDNIDTIRLLEKYKKRKLKYEKYLLEMPNDKNLSNNGFWDKGYLQGKIAMCDEFIDELQVVLEEISKESEIINEKE